MALSPNPIANFNQTLAAFLATYGVEFDNEKEEFTEDPRPWDWGNLVDCLWQTQWEHNRGDANTVKGVAGGSRTGTADIPLAADRFLVNRAGTLQGDVLLSSDLPAHSHTFDDTVHGARGGGTLHADVIAAGASGFMTGADKTKLDGISAGADVTTQAGLIAAGGMVVLDRQNTTTDITDNVLTTLYTYTVPANTLSAGARFVIELDWDALNNSGSTRTAAWSVAFGGTTMWANTSVSFGINNTRRPGTMRFSIHVRSASELVFRGDISHVSTTATSVTAGYGASGSNRSLAMQVGADMFAATLSNALTFTITHQWSANVANLSIRKLAATAHLG